MSGFFSRIEIVDIEEKVVVDPIKLLRENFISGVQKQIKIIEQAREVGGLEALRNLIANGKDPAAKGGKKERKRLITWFAETPKGFITTLKFGTKIFKPIPYEDGQGYKAGDTLSALEIFYKDMIDAVRNGEIDKQLLEATSGKEGDVQTVGDEGIADIETPPGGEKLLDDPTKTVSPTGKRAATK